MSVEFRYSNRYRPPSTFTPPKDWRLVERPCLPNMGFDLRIDLPVSVRSFGVVAFDRQLTPDECESYELDAVSVQERKS